MTRMTITIDGPAGVGKSTVARALASHLGVPYLNSGALYRAVAWSVIQQGVPPTDEDAVATLCAETTFVLQAVDENTSVLINGNILGRELRTPHISLVASKISKFPCVRAILLPLQRNYAAGQGVVAEGRDMGTEVFANADIKIFLEASAECRAERRHAELSLRGPEYSKEQTARELTERDIRDSTRAISPLLPSHDAVVIDTTRLSPTEVIDCIMELIRQKQARQETQAPVSSTRTESMPFINLSS